MAFFRIFYFSSFTFSSSPYLIFFLYLPIFILLSSKPSNIRQEPKQKQKNSNISKTFFEKHQNFYPFGRSHDGLLPVHAECGVLAVGQPVLQRAGQLHQPQRRQPSHQHPGKEKPPTTPTASRLSSHQHTGFYYYFYY